MDMLPLAFAGTAIIPPTDPTVLHRLLEVSAQISELSQRVEALEAGREGTSA